MPKFAYVIAMEVVIVNKKIRLETSRLILRDLVMGDASFIAERIAPLEVSQFLATVPHPYFLTDAVTYLEKVMCDQEKEKRKEYSLAIIPKAGIELA